MKLVYEGIWFYLALKKQKKKRVKRYFLSKAWKIVLSDEVPWQKYFL